MSTLEHIKLVSSTIDVATEVESEVETKAQVSQGSAYTTHDEFQNTALFLRLGLPSTRIRHENGAFQKRSILQTGGIWKQQLYGLARERKTSWLENGAFRNDGITIIIFLSKVFPKNKSKMTGYCFVFNRISPALCGRRTFEVLSEWNLHFHMCDSVCTVNIWYALEWKLHSRILLAKCGCKTFDALLVWNLCFTYYSAGQGLRWQS